MGFKGLFAWTLRWLAIPSEIIRLRVSVGDSLKSLTSSTDRLKHSAKSTIVSGDN